MTALSRRGFLGVLAGAIAAPAVIRSGILMPVRAIVEPLYAGEIGIYNGIVIRESFTIDDVLRCKWAMESAVKLPTYNGGYLIQIDPSMARLLRRSQPTARREVKWI